MKKPARFLTGNQADTEIRRKYILAINTGNSRFLILTVSFGCPQLTVLTNQNIKMIEA